MNFFMCCSLHRFMTTAIASASILPFSIFRQISFSKFSFTAAYTLFFRNRFFPEYLLYHNGHIVSERQNNGRRNKDIFYEPRKDLLHITLGRVCYMRLQPEAPHLTILIDLGSSNKHSIYNRITMLI